MNCIDKCNCSDINRNEKRIRYLSDCLKTIKYKLDKFPDLCLNKIDSDGWFPLHEATKCCRLDIVRFILNPDCFEDRVKTDVNIFTSSGYNPLHLAILNGWIYISSELINSGANINMKTYSGKTPLFLGAETNKKEIVKLLLENGADPKIRDNKGRLARDMTKNREIQKIIDEFQDLPS